MVSLGLSDLTYFMDISDKHIHETSLGIKPLLTKFLRPYEISGNMLSGCVYLNKGSRHGDVTKWKHFSALQALCEGNLPVTGEFLSQRPLTRSFDVFFDLRLNERLSKPSRSRWFETPLHPLWRQWNGLFLANYLQLHLSREHNLWHTDSMKQEILV